MARHDRLSQWTECVSTNMPHLTKPQATVLALWSFGIAFTLYASSLGDQFVVLAVCVVYRGCGIPVAWTILPAGKKRGWRREWLRMLRVLRPAIPRAWTVLVLADRGLYARWLFRRIVRLGWHPF